MCRLRELWGSQLECRRVCEYILKTFQSVFIFEDVSYIDRWIYDIKFEV